MKTDRFERWLRNIHNTREEELSCSECFDLVSRFVEEELSGADPLVEMSAVQQHLDQCPACHAEYETLRDLRCLEKQGKLPSVDDLQDLLH